MHTIGIDVGGTKIAGALVAVDGRILGRHRRPTARAGADVVDDILAVVDELRDGERPERVGVAVPGLVDSARGLLRYAPNLRWGDDALRDRLAERLPGTVVVVENDANAAGWGEFRFGAGRGMRDMLLLTVGTGVGGAVVSGGRLLRGGFGGAGEIGHLVVEPGGRDCGCGQQGCLEQYGSASALLRRMASGPGGQVASATGDDSVYGEELLARALADAPGELRAGLQEIGGWIGRGAAMAAAVLDPELIVVGGGAAVAGEELLAPIRSAFLDLLPMREHRPIPRFAIARLGNDAGVVGAAELARV